MRRLLLLAVMFASCTNPDEIFPVGGLIASRDSVDGQVVRLLRTMSHFVPGHNEPCDSPL